MGVFQSNIIGLPTRKDEFYIALGTAVTGIIEDGVFKIKQIESASENIIGITQEEFTGIQKTISVAIPSMISAVAGGEISPSMFVGSSNGAFVQNSSSPMGIALSGASIGDLFHLLPLYQKKGSGGGGGSYSIEGNPLVTGNNSAHSLDLSTLTEFNTLTQQLQNDEQQIDTNTNNIATLETSKISVTEKGAANGVATLGSNAKLPLNQIPQSLIGDLHYNGEWNATTNNPTLPTVPTDPLGFYRVVTVAGTLFGETWAVNDKIISSTNISGGTTPTNWGRIPNDNSVTSVNGKTGTVVVTKADVGLPNVVDGAQINVIEEIKLNNVALTPSGKSVNIPLTGNNVTGLSRLGHTETANTKAVKKDSSNLLYVDFDGVTSSEINDFHFSPSADPVFGAMSAGDIVVIKNQAGSSSSNTPPFLLSGDPFEGMMYKDDLNQYTCSLYGNRARAGYLPMAIGCWSLAGNFTGWHNFSTEGANSPVVKYNSILEMESSSPTNGQKAEVITISQFETSTAVTLLAQYGSGSIINGCVSRASGDKIVVGGTGAVSHVTAGNQFETNTPVIAITAFTGSVKGGIEDRLNKGITIFGDAGKFAHVGEGTDFTSVTPVFTFLEGKTINGGISDLDGGKTLYCNEGNVYYVPAGSEFTAGTTPIVMPAFITNIRAGGLGSDGSMHLGGASGAYSTVPYGSQFTASTTVIGIAGFGSDTIRGFIEDDNGNKYLFGTNGKVCYASSGVDFTDSTPVFQITGFGASAIKSASKGTDGGLHFFGNSGKVCFIEKDTTLIATSAVITITNFSAANIESSMVDTDGGITITGSGGLVSYIPSGQKLAYWFDGTNWVLLTIAVPATTFGSGESMVVFDTNGKPKIAKTGTVERCIAIRDVNQTCPQNAHTQIDFSETASKNTAGIKVNSSGEIECFVNGYYSAMFRAYIDEFSDPIFSIYVQKWDSKLPTPAWINPTGALHKVKVKDDGGLTVSFEGGGNLYAGDKIRIVVRPTSGMVQFKNTSEPALGGGTATQLPVVFTIARIGDNTVEV